MKKNNYEGMFIFLDILKDEELEAAVKDVREEIEKLDGEVENTARMGRRPFARLQGKRHKTGQYVVMNFSMPPQNIQVLLPRLKLKNDLFRTQILAQTATAEPVTA